MRQTWNGSGGANLCQFHALITSFLSTSRSASYARIRDSRAGCSLVRYDRASVQYGQRCSGIEFAAAHSGDSASALAGIVRWWAAGCAWPLAALLLPVGIGGAAAQVLGEAVGIEQGDQQEIQQNRRQRGARESEAGYGIEPGAREEEPQRDPPAVLCPLLPCVVLVAAAPPEVDAVPRYVGEEDEQTRSARSAMGAELARAWLRAGGELAPSRSTGRCS